MKHFFFFPLFALDVSFCPEFKHSCLNILEMSLVFFFLFLILRSVQPECFIHINMKWTDFCENSKLLLQINKKTFKL